MMLIEQCQAIWNQSHFHQLLRNKSRKIAFMLPIWLILKLLSSKRHHCFVTPSLISPSTLLQSAQQDYADRQLVTRVGAVELQHRQRTSPSHETINGEEITCAVPLLSIHTHSKTKLFYFAGCWFHKFSTCDEEWKPLQKLRQFSWWAPSRHYLQTQLSLLVSSCVKKF